MDITKTPLGVAREAIDAALQEIEEALEDADRIKGDWGHRDLELNPDETSVGFKLVLSYPEDVGPDAREVEVRLHGLLKKWGITTVVVLGTNIDPVEVK